jgi:chromosome segregation ATPase
MVKLPAKPPQKTSVERRLSETEAHLASIDRKLTEVSTDAFNNSVELRQVHRRLDSVDQKLDRILDVADANAKELNDVRTELAANQKAHDRFEAKLKARSA